MAQDFFTGAQPGAGAGDDAEGPPPRRPLATMPEEVEVAEIGRLRTVVDVVRSDLCRLEGAVAECRRDNSRTMAEVLRRQEEFIQSGAPTDQAAVRDPLQTTLLEQFVLDKVGQERRARAEELSEVRRWAVELMRGCMQPLSNSGAGSHSSKASTVMGSGVGVDTAESTTCSASDIGNDVRFSVAAMKVQLSELQDEFARSQERLSTLASRMAALEQGECRREATADLAASLASRVTALEQEECRREATADLAATQEDEDAIAELLSRTRGCVRQPAKAAPPSPVSGGDQLIHTVTAMRELLHENAGLREENLKLVSNILTTVPGSPASGADSLAARTIAQRALPEGSAVSPLSGTVVGQSTSVPPRPPAMLAGTVTAPATPHAKSGAATDRNMSPARGRRSLNSGADSLAARTIAQRALPAGSAVSPQAAALLPHASILPADRP